MQKIVIVSQYIRESQNSTGYYYCGLINGLKHEFDLVDVISDTPVFVSGKTHNEYFSAKSPKNRLLTRLREQLALSFRFGWRILHSLNRRDVLVTGTNPVLLLPLIAVLKRFCGFRWCLIVHDVFPDNLVPAGILSQNSILYRLIDAFFRHVYKSADKIVVIGRDMEKLFVYKIGSPEPVVFIPNWASDQDVFPIPRCKVPFINELGWKDKIVFQFFGNIGRLQGIDNILQAISLTKNEELAFLFIGAGAMIDAINSFILKNPDKNVAYVGPLPLDKKNLGLAACDVAIVTLESGMSGLGVPSKSYFSMAADKPILAVMDNSAEISMVVKEYSIGWVCESGNPEKLAGLIDEISRNDISRVSGRPRAVLQEFFSEKRAIGAYKKTISELFEAD